MHHHSRSLPCPYNPISFALNLSGEVSFPRMATTVFELTLRLPVLSLVFYYFQCLFSFLSYCHWSQGGALNDFGNPRVYFRSILFTKLIVLRFVKTS